MTVTHRDARSTLTLPTPGSSPPPVHWQVPTGRALIMTLLGVTADAVTPLIDEDGTAQELTAAGG